MAKRTQTGGQVIVLIGGRRWEDLTPEERERYGRHVAQVMAPAALSYAELEMRRERKQAEVGQ